jgi:DNA-directed RNA polymerase subunit RPC12/RpoP
MTDLSEEKRERIREYQRTYRERNKVLISEKEKQRYAQLTDEDKLNRSEKAHEYHLNRNFGISKDQYNALLEKQEYGCAICKKTCNKGIRLAVDHDHKTDEIRGLLCGFCNHRVIGRHRRGGLLPQAAAYLEKEYTGWFVPPKKKRRRKPRKAKRVGKTT